MVDSYLNIGKNTLSELYSQRNRFKVIPLLTKLTYVYTHVLILGCAIKSVGYAELLGDVE